MNPARANILRRVRQALRQPAPAPVPAPADPIWPPTTDLEATFLQEFTALRGEIVTDLPAFLASFTQIHFAPGCSTVLPIHCSVPVHQAELGVTGCDFLLARTGSILLSSRSGGGRLPSVLPPVHLVLARRDQLVTDLDQALPLLRQRYQASWPSMISLITGPSRTADIEKVLVLGAHGPKRLALCWVP